MNGNIYKARMAAIGVSAISIKPEIEKQAGCRITPSELSLALNFKDNSPKSFRIRDAANEILKKREGTS